MKTLKYIVIAAAAALVFASCNNDPKLSGIESESMRIAYGYKGAVAAYPKPWNCTDYQFSYKSNNEDIVLVDEKYGTLTTEGLGSTTVTVTCGSYSVDVPVEVYTDIPEEIWGYQIGDLIQDKLSNGLNGLWEFNKRHAMEATVGKDLVPHYPDSNGSRGPVSDDGYDWLTGFHPFDGAILTKYNACFELYCNLTSSLVYTFMIDAMRPSATSDNRYTTFLNWNQDNAADQYIYWRKDGCFQFGGSGDYRSGSEYFSNDKWFRMVFLMDQPNGIQKVFANGEKILDVASPNGTGFLPFTDMVLLNGDNDGDDAPLYYTTVAVWDRALTDAEVATLGEPVTY